MLVVLVFAFCTLCTLYGVLGSSGSSLRFDACNGASRGGCRFLFPVSVPRSCRSFSLFFKPFREAHPAWLSLFLLLVFRGPTLHIGNHAFLCICPRHLNIFCRAAGSGSSYPRAATRKRRQPTWRPSLEPCRARAAGSERCGNRCTGVLMCALRP